MIALNRPFVPPLEEFSELIQSANERAWLSNFGPLEGQLTDALRSYLGVDHLLLVNNGSSALQVAYRTLNIRHAITTPFSFIATASTLDWLDIDFSFADIDAHSMNLKPDLVAQGLEQNSSIDSVVATHVYGNPCDVTALEALCQQYDKKLVFDAAHAFSVNIDNRSVLNFGDASVLSFHATKIFNSIEGGAIIFKRQEDYDIAREMICFGMDKTAAIKRTGINAKMNEYQAAAGLVCLMHVDKLLQHRQQLEQAYRESLSDVVAFPQWHPSATSNGAYMPIILSDEAQLMSVARAFDDTQIGFRRYFYPDLATLYPDKACIPHNLPVTSNLSARVMCIPMHAYLTFEEVEQVCQVIRGAIK